MAANPMASRSAALAGAAQAMNKPKMPGGDFRQNLAGATGGTIKGANGGTQQLGVAAQRRLASGGGAAPVGPNMAGGGLNPAMPPPGVRTPPIMDPMQSPMSASPGMTPYQPGGNGGAVGSGSVDPMTPGDPNAKLGSTGPGGMTSTQPGAGIVPPMQGGDNGQGGSPNMGGVDPGAFAKLSGSVMSGLPGFQPAIDIGHAPGADPGGTMTMNGQPGSTPWMPPGGPGGPPGMKPDPHGGGGPLGGAPGAGGSIGGTMPPMNTKPLPGAMPGAPGANGAGGGIWGRIAGAGGQQMRPRNPAAGGNMASF